MNAKPQRIVIYQGHRIDTAKPNGQIRTGKNRANFLSRTKQRINQSSGNQGGGTGQRSNVSTQQKSFRTTNNRSSNRVVPTVSANIRGINNLINSLRPSTDLKMYLAAVLDPFYAPSDAARIPTSLPLKTACVTLTYSGIVTTNASGNFQLFFQPQTGINGNWNQYLVILNDASLTSANNFLQDVAVNPTIVGLYSDMLNADVALKVRTVGAGLRCYYIGTEQTRQGYYVSAIYQTPAPKDAANGNKLRQGYNEMSLKQAPFSNELANRENPEVIYIPREDVDLDFYDFGAARQTSHSVIAGYAFPANASCIRYEMKIHLEYIVNTNTAVGKLIPMAESEANPEQASSIMNDVSKLVPEFPTSSDNMKPLGIQNIDNPQEAVQLTKQYVDPNHSDKYSREHYRDLREKFGPYPPSGDWVGGSKWEWSGVNKPFNYNPGFTNWARIYK